MARRFRDFLNCEHGNVALLGAGAVFPILILCAGVIDHNRHSRLKAIMQTAADAAVMSAFEGPTLKWPDRQRKARLHFRANLGGRAYEGEPVMNLTKKLYQDRVRLKFTAWVKTDSIFGSLSPFSDLRIDVAAHAQWRRGIDQRPHLIDAETASSLSDRQP